MKLIDLLPRLLDWRAQGKTLQSEQLAGLYEIGRALGAERDLGRLLDRTLTITRRLLVADAASIFLGDGDDPAGPTHLRFKLAQNDSVPLEFKEFLLPIDASSLAGHVASTRESIRVQDAYEIPASFGFRINPDFDKKSGYRSKSVLSIPMTDHRDQLIGVIQIWNKKKAFDLKVTPENVEEVVIPFTEEDQHLLEAFAGQAGIAIENARLYENIERLFEGFIRASVAAIEARDPTTAGHSERVATLTVGLCEEVDALQTGPYAHVKFTSEDLKEINYAGLLHDFGKIGVREAVLRKAKKLYPWELETLSDRFALFHRSVELEIERRKLQHLIMGGRPNDAVWKQYEEELERRLSQLREAHQTVLEANEPAILPKILADMSELAPWVIERPDQSVSPLLTADQRLRLSIPKGTLSTEERREIESHVSHTYQFLSRIPWTRGLRRVPGIAWAHHEKLDGTGYPRGIRGEDIPFPSRIMAIVDIFDALVAQDRPYKKTLDVPKALDILRMEAGEGKLDEELVRIFAERQVYRRTAPGA